MFSADTELKVTMSFDPRKPETWSVAQRKNFAANFDKLMGILRGSKVKTLKGYGDTYLHPTAGATNVARFGGFGIDFSLDAIKSGIDKLSSIVKSGVDVYKSVNNITKAPGTPQANAGVQEITENVDPNKLPKEPSGFSLMPWFIGGWILIVGVGGIMWMRRRNVR